MPKPGHDISFSQIGEALSLLAQAPFYADRSLASIGDILLPPMALGQIRLWRRGGRPVALATWAFLNAETEHAVLHDDHLPAPDAWNCGPRPVVIDFLAPFGDGFAVARDLQRTVFADRAGKSVRRDAAGRVLRIIQHPGLDEHGQRVKARAFAA